MLKGLVISIAATLLSVLPELTYAQESDLLNKVTRSMASSCTELTYTYAVSLSGTDNVGDGNLALQGQKWSLVGNGLEMFCDSVSLWIIDPDAKEVVIEPVDHSSDFNAFTSPAVIFARLHELFQVKSVVPSDDGQTLIYVLKGNTVKDIDYINLEILKKDQVITSCTVALADGSLIKIKVSSMKLTPLRDLSDFRPKTSFNSSWIVTDVR